jgi:hypothetical protein
MTQTDKKGIKPANKYKKVTNKKRDIDDDDLESNSKNFNNIDLEKKVKEMMWPYVKQQFGVNNFDNRFKAQEKLLHEQHQMIKGNNYSYNIFE